jgi:proteasome lid subunit RPN8/RPN11
VPWQLTDDALAALNACLLGHPPERGAALLGPAGRPLITHVLPDPEAGTTTGYTHSPPLQQLLTAVLDRRPDLAYRGTAHSHPGAMAEPSRQDLAAFGAVRDTNPHLAPAPVFPIVVAAGRSALAEVTPAWGDDHLLDLPGGTLAGYALSSDRDQAVPVTLSVLPVGAVTTALRRSCDVGCHEAGNVGEPTTGSFWLRYLLRPEESTAQPAISVLIHPGYPWVAPLLAIGDEPCWSPAWDLGAPPARRLALAADALLERCRG